MGRPLESRIESIEWLPLDLKLTEPFGIAGASQEVADLVLVRVTLEGGVTGLGEGAPSIAARHQDPGQGEDRESVIAALKSSIPALLSCDSGSPEVYAALLAESSPECSTASAALEMAIEDAHCRSIGISCRSLSGDADAALRTDWTIPTGDTDHATVSASRIAAAGFSSIKVKVGDGDWHGDIARLQAISQAAPNCSLIADGNGGFDAQEAIAFTEELSGRGIELGLFEQPVPGEDLEELARVTAAVDVPVCADEAVRSRTDVEDLIRLSAADAINIKVMKSGLAEARVMTKMAQDAGLGLMIGGMVESILAMTVSAHLASGLGGFSWIDLDTPFFIGDHPFEGGFITRGDLLELPLTAGHGVRLARELNGWR